MEHLLLKLVRGMYLEIRVGVSTPWRGGVDPENLGFHLLDIRVVDVRKDSVLEVGPYPPRVRRNWPPLVGLYPPRMALALRAPVNQRVANGIGFSPLSGAVSTRENSVFTPGLSGL